MYPGCLSRKCLVEHMPFVVYFVEVLVSEDYLYNKNLREGFLLFCHVSVVM